MRNLFIAFLVACLCMAGMAAVSTAFQASGPTLPTAITAVELPKVDDGLKIDDYLFDVPYLATNSSPDDVGAFRFICSASTTISAGKAGAYTAANDPVVYPGQPGRSHEHQFYGNDHVSAFSTYNSLRTSGLSSCRNILNRSAYWVPAMRTGFGKVRLPEFMSVYYKRVPNTHPACMVEGINRCVDHLPRGLRYIFGFDMITDTVTSGGLYWDVQGGTSTPGHYKDLVEAGPHVDPVNGLVGSIVTSPGCWDGKSLDSPNHRSHMADQIVGESTIAVPNDPNRRVCPDTHPWIVAKFTLATWYKADASLDRSGIYTPGQKTWHLSSDRMYGMPEHRPGSTLHADWFGAWNDAIVDLWFANCINRRLSCADGNLGNGKQMRDLSGGYGNPQPAIVPMAAMAREPFRATIGPTK